MINPKISIIIPVYNVAQYLSRCLDSILSQTLVEIEIICIDDFSNDGSQAILDHYAVNDPRIIVVRHSGNKGILMARKSGVRIASGEFILFVDSDDSIEPTACEILYQAMIKAKVDICHFPTKVVNNSANTDLRGITEFVKPYYHKLKDADVFNACFFNSDYYWSIWNKLYNTSLCKAAYEAAGDFYCNMAEDVYTYFILSYFATSYIGVESQPFITTITVLG